MAMVPGIPEALIARVTQFILDLGEFMPKSKDSELEIQVMRRVLDYIDLPADSTMPDREIVSGYHALLADIRKIIA